MSRPPKLLRKPKARRPEKKANRAFWESLREGRPPRVPSPAPKEQSVPLASLEPVKVCQIGAYPFRTLAKDPRNEVFSISMKDIQAYREKQFAVEDVASKLPQEFHQFLDVFDKDGADTLPPHRALDCQINLR